MATRNIYLNYKRDTNYLVRWIVQVSNKLLTTAQPDAGDITVNTTGGITVSSIISARTSTHTHFERMAAELLDLEIQESNAKHKYFIDTLVRAFEILGGKEKEAGDKASKQETTTESEDLDELLFVNKFSALAVHHNADVSDSESDGEPQQTQFSPAAAAAQRRRPGKGKKGKKGGMQQQKKKTQAAQPVSQPNLDHVPLESFRIIQDSSGITSDYLMAVYALVLEWTGLRQYLQEIWRRVAYDGLNSAVAGSLSNMAVAMVRRSASDMFVDFPGHESYETVMKTITRGDIDKSQGTFAVSLAEFKRNGELEVVKSNPVDIREHLLIHAYQDLLDFVTDFQCTRSGKPTKRMQNSIKDWNPELNLERATKAERLQWRRSYTINWLYDLVNVFSSVVVQRNTLKGENHILEKVDWSVNGRWDKYRRIYGLEEFAGFVTSLAMQKQGTDVRNRILPHHVFQLQCIVDSLTVSRGWSVHPLEGTVIKSPAHKFNPKRDVDLFLDRAGQRFGKGFCGSLDFLKKYSPFLCGVGLAEALEISYKAGMWIWDRSESFPLLFHIHNMLVKTGYIKKPVGLYMTLQCMFQNILFEDGKIPKDKFEDGLVAMFGAIIGTRREEKARDRARKSIRGKQFGEECILHETITAFKQKSALMVYHEADWDLDCIPDSEAPWPSTLTTFRLARTKRIMDRTTGRERLEETALVKRLIAKGSDHETLFSLSQSLADALKHVWGMTEQATPQVKEKLEALCGPGYKHDFHQNLSASVNASASSKRPSNNVQLDGPALLWFPEKDLKSDINGAQPYSAVNYIWVLTWVLMTWHRIEDALSEARNRLYIEAYESKPGVTGFERLELAISALASQDPHCLKIMARELESPRVGLVSHIYWDGLDLSEEQQEEEGKSKAVYYGPELPPGFKRASINPAPDPEPEETSPFSTGMPPPPPPPPGMLPPGMFPPGMIPMPGNGGNPVGSQFPFSPDHEPSGDEMPDLRPGECTVM
ncbi:hypothetical protein QBC43DRAFT_361571 [Cladorrhinum sp. PSN259]|nr:hypothetical protein QBC43DRAFT_361571 [Cladorrhinum sp. PSN259]